MALRYTNITGPSVYPGSTSIAVLRLQHRLNNLQCPVCLAEATNKNAQNTDQWVDLHTGPHPHTMCLGCRRQMNRMQYGRRNCPLCKEKINIAYDPDLRGVTFVPGVNILMGPLDKPLGRNQAWWWFEHSYGDQPSVEVKLNPGIIELHVIVNDEENTHHYTRKYSLERNFRITANLLKAKVYARFSDSDHATIVFKYNGVFKRFDLHLTDNGGFPFVERS